MNHEINIHIHKLGDETDEILCNWCGLMHPCSPAYKKNFFSRTKKQLEDAGVTGIPLALTWTCGACWCHLNNMPSLTSMVECDHPVPKESQVIKKKTEPSAD